MKPKEAFGVAVRVVGLLIILVSVLYFVSAIIVFIDPTYRPNLAPAWHYFIDPTRRRGPGLPWTLKE
jgi:hypothetical protein